LLYFQTYIFKNKITLKFIVVIFVNVTLSFLLFMAIGLLVFSDMIIGNQITRNRARYMIDKAPPGHVLAVILTINNMVDMEWARKGPYGKREFKYNGREVSVIDKGDYPVHFPNGNIGFICHEKSEKNLNMHDVVYADNLRKKFKTNNIKEMFHIAKKREERK